MTDDIEQPAKGVNPPRRDKLSRLGDKLDATEGDGSDSWVALYMEYEALAIAHALASRLPKVKIKSTAALWAADTLWMTLWEREKAIKANIAANDRRRLRTVADLKALLAVTERDMRVYAEAMRQYKADKQANKQKAITIAKHRRERVRGIAKAIHSAIGRATS